MFLRICCKCSKSSILYREDMGPNEENKLANGDIQAHRNIDWTRYGLHDPETHENIERDNKGNNSAFDPEMYQTSTNELFAQEYVSICKQMLTYYIVSIKK